MHPRSKQDKYSLLIDEFVSNRFEDKNAIWTFDDHFLGDKDKSILSDRRMAIKLGYELKDSIKAGQLETKTISNLKGLLRNNLSGQIKDITDQIQKHGDNLINKNEDLRLNSYCKLMDLKKHLCLVLSCHSVPRLLGGREGAAAEHLNNKLLNIDYSLSVLPQIQNGRLSPGYITTITDLIKTTVHGGKIIPLVAEQVAEKIVDKIPNKAERVVPIPPKLIPGYHIVDLNNSERTNSGLIEMLKSAVDRIGVSTQTLNITFNSPVNNLEIKDKTGSVMISKSK